MATKYGTTYNCYIIQCGDECVLIETVKNKDIHTEQLLARLYDAVGVNEDGSHKLRRVLESTLNASERNHAIGDAFKYYYDAVMSPFPSYIQQGLDIIKGLDPAPRIIAPAHGPIHDMDHSNLIERYDKWSKAALAVERDLVLVGYCSIYGFTENLAMAYADGVREATPYVDVRMFDLEEVPTHELVSLLPRCKILALGAPTINKDTVEFVKEILDEIPVLLYGKMYASVFGSYGWSGEGIGIVRERLEHSKIIMPFSPVATRFK
eukprot:g8196.t1